IGIDVARLPIARAPANDALQRAQEARSYRRAFNAEGVQAAAALYDPDAAIIQVDDVHGGRRIKVATRKAIPQTCITTLWSPSQAAGRHSGGLHRTDASWAI